MKPTHAMVLAAGRGERLRPLTDSIPKPMVQVAGRSLIDRQLDKLEAFGIEQAIVNTAYLAEKLEAHLSQRTAPPIVFSRETTALETGGGVKQALSLLGNQPFFVMNSDVVLVDRGPAALTRLAESWDASAFDILLLLHPRETAIGFDGPGDFFLESDNLTPRRRGTAATAPYIFTGTQILSAHLFADMPEGAFSLNRLYDKHRTEAGVLHRVGAIVHQGDWLHVGDPAGLSAAEGYFARAMA